MAQAPGVLQERRREEDRTLSPGLARCCQLCASKWLGSVSQRGKTSPQAYSRLPKRHDVEGAGAFSPHESRPKEGA